MYSPIAVRPIPTDRAITRSLAPQAYFRRRTSRTFRIDNLSAGIRPPFANCKRRTLPGSDCRQRSPLHPINRRWPPSIGILVAAFRRIGAALSNWLAGCSKPPTLPSKLAAAAEALALVEHGHSTARSCCASNERSPRAGPCSSRSTDWPIDGVWEAWRGRASHAGPRPSMTRSALAGAAQQLKRVLGNAAFCDLNGTCDEKAEHP